MLQFWCLSPVRVAYHGSFRENLESAFGALECHITTWRNTCESSNRWSWNVAVWCLSPVRAAYHGPFRENLEPAFWGLGVSYHNIIKHMQVFKAEHLKCCSFGASPQSKWLITAHLERIWSQHFGALGCHITSWLSTNKSPKRSSWNVAVLMPLPSQSGLSQLIQRESGVSIWGLGLSYHNLIKHMRAFKREQLKCCSFDTSPQSEWLITAHLERIWIQHFGALNCHITT